MYRYLKRVCKEDGVRLLSVVSSDGTRHSGQTERQEFLSEHQDIGFLHGESDQALAQVVQRTCGVSILGDIEKLSGYSPGQLALVSPISAGELVKVTSRGPFQPNLLYDSMKS